MPNLEEDSMQSGYDSFTVVSRFLLYLQHGAGGSKLWLSEKAFRTPGDARAKNSARGGLPQNASVPAPQGQRVHGKTPAPRSSTSRSKLCRESEVLRAHQNKTSPERVPFKEAAGSHAGPTPASSWHGVRQVPDELGSKLLHSGA